MAKKSLSNVAHSGLRVFFNRIGATIAKQPLSNGTATHLFFSESFYNFPQKGKIIRHKPAGLDLYLTDVLERLRVGVDDSQLAEIKAEAVAKYAHFEEVVASYLTGEDAIERLLKSISRAYTIHPNKLLDNLEQLSQLRDQVYELFTITPPVSYLMQTQKSILPTYLFAEEDVQAQMRANLPEFFSYLDLSNVGEILEGQTLYASWVMAKWIREERRLSEILDKDLEIAFSSYCVLFIDRIVKVLGVEVDPMVFMMLVRGPSDPEYNITFETVMSIEIKFWEAVLHSLMGDAKVLGGEVPLMESPMIQNFDEKFVLEYVMVPEIGRRLFDDICIPLKKFFLAEKFATICETVNRIATNGFEESEINRLNSFLTEAIE